MDRVRQRRKRHRPNDERQFHVHLADGRDRRIDSLKLAVVAARHQRVGREHGHTRASRALALRRAVYNKARFLGYDLPSPARSVQPFRPRARDRSLRPDALPQFIDAPRYKDRRWQDCFLSCRYIGARRSSVSSMRWQGVDLQAEVWRIPHTRRGKPHFVPLPTAAFEVLRRRRERHSADLQVFPRTWHCYHVWRRIVQRAGLADLRSHDLPRTLGRWQAAAGVALHVIGKALRPTQPRTMMIESVSNTLIAAGGP